MNKANQTSNKPSGKPSAPNKVVRTTPSKPKPQSGTGPRVKRS